MNNRRVGNGATGGNQAGARVDPGCSLRPAGGCQQATVNGGDLRNDYTDTGE